MTSSQLACVSLGLCTLASASALVADPLDTLAAPFETRSSGYLDLHGGVGGFFTSAGDFPMEQFGGAGRVNTWLTPSLTVQFDLWGEVILDDNLVGDAPQPILGFAAHLGHRDPAVGHIGGLVSVGSSHYWNNPEYVTVAMEGQRYFGNATIFGQAGYTHGASGVGHPGSWYAYGGGRHFFTPNLMAELSGGLSAWRDDASSNTALRWGGRFEYKPETHRFSVFAAYEGGVEFWDYAWDFSDHLFFVGARYYFNQDTLLSHDRTGASLYDYNTMYGQSFEH
jgi:hypothetical protein